MPDFYRIQPLADSVIIRALVGGTLMNREILFRAKQVCGDEWIEGYYLNCYYPGNSTDQTGNFIVEYPGKYHEIYLETLCQYVGLIDKNGKKIFEGDIVKSDLGKVGKIAYNETHLSYLILENTEMKYYYIQECDSGHIEVIGNIFDNPDLIKD